MTLVIAGVFIHCPIRVICITRSTICNRFSIPSTMCSIWSFVIIFQILHIQLTLCPCIQYFGNRVLHSIRVFWVITRGDNVVKPTFTLELVAQFRIKAKRYICFLKFGIRHNPCYFVITQRKTQISSSYSSRYRNRVSYIESCSIELVYVILRSLPRHWFEIVLRKIFFIICIPRKIRSSIILRTPAFIGFISRNVIFFSIFGVGFKSRLSTTSILILKFRSYVCSFNRYRRFYINSSFSCFS